jgi:hypothetical protein
MAVATTASHISSTDIQRYSPHIFLANYSLLTTALKVARNLLEEKVAKKHARHAPQKTNPVANRLLRPRYLCVLNDPESSDMAGWQRVFINDWTKEHRSNRPLPYLFISYTTEQFPSNSNSHCDTLHQVAERAARAEGLPAYWISCSCMPDPDQLQDDVWKLRLCTKNSRYQARD